MSASEFIERIERLLLDRRGASARQWVFRYPDVALAALRDPELNRTVTPALQAIARFHDEHLSHNGEGSWQRLIRDKFDHPDPYSINDQRRTAILDRLRQDQSEEVAGLLEEYVTKPEKKIRPRRFLIENLRFAGIAWFMANEPQQACIHWEKALEIVGVEFPYEACDLMLLKSVALMRSGMNKEAETAWVNASMEAASLLEKVPSIKDPSLWNRIIHLRPAAAKWPEEITTKLEKAFWSACWGNARDKQNRKERDQQGAAVDISDPEAMIYACIGCWYLERREPRPAVISLKHAEVNSDGSYGKELIRLKQAVALAQMNQADSAMPMLMNLSKSINKEIASAGRVMLGTMYLTRGSVERGISLLRETLESGNENSFPGRAQAEADLALAYLSQGDEARGLSWLHTAQSSFEKNDTEQWIRSIQNEARYMENTGRSSEAERLRQRITRIEESSIIPNPPGSIE